LGELLEKNLQETVFLRNIGNGGVEELTKGGNLK
jgi:hypothetical protein